MREQEAEFSRYQVKIAVVTFENDFFARQYVAETGLRWPLLIDTTRAAYHGYGMLAASFWDIWGPSTWWVYARELLKGQKLQKSSGDITQRAGDVLIDPDGRIAKVYTQVAPAGHSDEVLAALAGLQKH